ncbi:MAG: hypothetical protein IJ796_00040 [Lachnospiraceae bacterium]|nr:hypothetical protein [Lachnospiraceae bacterium]
MSVMKKVRLVVLIMSCMLIYGAFALGSDDDSNTTTSGGNVGDTAQSAPSSSSSSSSSTEEDDKSKVKIYVTNKTNIDADILNGIYMPVCNFTFKIENGTSKTIRGIEAVVTMKDMFGNQIKKSSLQLTDEVGPGKTVYDDTQGMEINEFIDSDVKLWNTDYKDMTFEVKVTNIVYK